MKNFMGSIYLFCAFTLAGTSVISARLVSGKLGTFTITALSLFFAVIFLLPLCWRRLNNAVRILTLYDLIFLSLQALFGIFLFRMFLLNGLLHTSTGEAGILTGATPAITALLALILLKEPVKGINIVGILSTIGGILLIQGLLSYRSNFSSGHIYGNMLILCAAACESTFNIFSRISAIKQVTGRREMINPVVQTTIVSAIALLFCLIPAISEQPVPLLSDIGIKEWLALFWYGLFVTSLAFVFWYAGIKRCGAFTAAAFSGMMPFTAMLLSVVFLGERSGWQQWSGGVLVIIGMVLISSSVPVSRTLSHNINNKKSEHVIE